jgi:hypothetical protein
MAYDNQRVASGLKLHVNVIKISQFPREFSRRQSVVLSVVITLASNQPSSRLEPQTAFKSRVKAAFDFKGGSLRSTATATVTHTQQHPFHLPDVCYQLLCTTLSFAFMHVKN